MRAIILALLLFAQAVNALPNWLTLYADLNPRRYAGIDFTHNYYDHLRYIESTKYRHNDLLIKSQEIVREINHDPGINHYYGWSFFEGFNFEAGFHAAQKIHQSSLIRLQSAHGNLVLALPFSKYSTVIAGTGFGLVNFRFKDHDNAMNFSAFKVNPRILAGLELYLVPSTRFRLSMVWHDLTAFGFSHMIINNGLSFGAGFNCEY